MAASYHVGVDVELTPPPENVGRDAGVRESKRVLIMFGVILILDIGAWYLIANSFKITM